MTALLNLVAGLDVIKVIGGGGAIKLDLQVVIIRDNVWVCHRAQLAGSVPVLFVDAVDHAGTEVHGVAAVDVYNAVKVEVVDIVAIVKRGYSIPGGVETI